MKVQIELDNEANIFRPGNMVVGRVWVTSSPGDKHEGLTVEINGSAHLVTGSKRYMLFDCVSVRAIV